MSELKYRADIDGLRAIAVLAVVIYHAGFSALSGGFVGVDVFFVISGYLITRIVWGQSVNDGFSYLRFYEKRARRIFPALLVMLFTVMAVGYFVMMPEALQSLANSAIASVFSLSNIYFWRQTGYFATASELFPLLHTWSLGVEEQFYIFLPVLVSLVCVIRRSSAFFVFSILIAFSFFLCVYLSTRHPSANFFLLPTRAWELGIGSLLALSQGSKAIKNKIILDVLSFLGLFLIFYSVIFFSKETVFPGYSALAPCLGAALIIYCGSCSERLFVNRFLSVKPMVFIGLISYSLYLWHWPVFVFLRHLSGSIQLSFFWALTGIAFSFFLAYLSWKFVEKPFRKTQFVTTKILWPSLISCTGVILAFSMMISFYGKGFPARIKDGAIDVIAVKQDFDRSCMNISINSQETFSEECLIGNAGEPDFILIGDSHAAAIKPAIKFWAEKNTATGVFQSFNACPPLGGTVFGIFKGESYSDCQKYAAETKDFIINSSQISTVFITAYWPAYMSRTDAQPVNVTAGLRVHPESSQTLAKSNHVFLNELRSYVEDIVNSNKRVVLLYGLPEPGTDVPWAAATAIQLFGDYSWSFKIKDDSFFANKVNGLVDSNLYTSIDLSAAMCNDRLCSSFVDGYVIYKDNNHLSASAAKGVFGPLLVRDFE